MLYDDHMKDRFCRFTYNPQTSEYERNWIQYADNTFEPVRRVGNLKKKFEAQRTNFNWWTVKKPAQWRPKHEGHDFSWNHTLGEETKPKNWGNKSKRERKAGATPYFLQLDLNDAHRIESRTERINDRRETWEFEYDDAGRLTSVIGDTGWCEDFEYDDKGRRKADYAVGREPFMRSYQYTDDDRLLAVDTLQFEHDALGFRSAKINGESVTRYKYSKDYRLLGVLLPDGREITFDHDKHGRRQARYVNGTLDEAYQWKNFIRLDRFKDEVNDWQFHYDKEERIPYKATVNGTDYTLYYDQVGSLKAVVSPTGNVVKAIQYGPFGNILWDSNPTLRVPIGFAGGVHDPDTGFVRFGWRDYDPDTARWTAQDPIGDAGGDADWYGYCLDDPVNMFDPMGLYGKGNSFSTGRAAADRAGHIARDGKIDAWDTPSIAGPNTGNEWHAQSKDVSRKAAVAMRAKLEHDKMEKAQKAEAVAEQAAQEADAKAEAEARKQRTEVAVAAHLKAHQDKLNNMLSEIDTPKENVLSDKTGGNPVKTGISDATPKNNVVHEDKSPEQSPARPSPKDKGGLMSKATRIQQAAMRTKREQEAVKNYEESDASRGWNGFSEQASTRSTPQDVEALKTEEKKNGVHTSQIYTGPREYSYEYMNKARKRIGTGIGKAFSSLFNSFVTNDDFRNWTLGTIGFGLAPAAVVASSPGVITATATGLTNPVTAQKIGDFVTGAFDPSPPQTAYEGLGYAVKEACDTITK
ncbi:hypothetical protein SYK_25090 [Pseudodesulfovibrio nedwellii]|uniref:Teneurin-like YD-shell domain-containing protein n=1 Tax=Pseudodesulfovibrio nedwellii TaxID=2973072 RepID=A0ABN6S4J8_9BACT|nr:MULTISPECIES: RHS repeat-associated core domain-containing protein [Pseudodesulfovibrio]BDQ38149.1 hypothetical protein SYK_25090 [Pseudodesulfovibrio nedwellii]